MRKAFATVLLFAVLASALAAPATFEHPKLQAGESTMSCFIGIVQRMGEITTDPTGLLLDLFACYGDATWDYVAPFVGAYMRPMAYQVWMNLAVDGNGDKAMTELELYNYIMMIIKQAIGEILSYVPGSPNFRYIESTVTA